MQFVVSLFRCFSIIVIALSRLALIDCAANTQTYRETHVVVGNLGRFFSLWRDLLFKLSSVVEPVNGFCHFTLNSRDFQSFWPKAELTSCEPVLTRNMSMHINNCKCFRVSPLLRQSVRASMTFALPIATSACIAESPMHVIPSCRRVDKKCFVHE